MVALTWDDRSYSAGISNVVLYGDRVEAWSGVISIQEDESDSSTITGYYDGQAYIRHSRPGSTTGTIECYSIPEAIKPTNFYGVAASSFNLTYRDNQHIHILYNVLAESVGYTYKTMDETTGVDPYSISFFTQAVKAADTVSGHFLVKLSEVSNGAIAEIEKLLYGSPTTEPDLPPPNVLLDIFERNAVFRVIDHGDGTWTATGPDSWFNIQGTQFSITSPSARYLDETTYTIKSV